MIQCPICFHVNDKSRVACEKCGWKFKKPLLHSVRGATAVLILACIAAVGAWWVSSGGLLGEQRHAATKALSALKKIEAATQVGVTYQYYGKLLIDAKAQVNEALSVLPEGELKKELNATMEAYMDAETVWKDKITNQSLVLSQQRLVYELVPKYSLTTLFHDEVVQLIWIAANTHLDRAASIIGR